MHAPAVEPDAASEPGSGADAVPEVVPAVEPDAAPHVAGYRPLRLLGAGPRAVVHLARAPDGGLVALKRLRDRVPASDAWRELRVLHAAAGPHSVRLLDVAADSRGRPVAVLEALPAVTLADVLARHAELEPGEAVTLLAPLAALVDRLQRRGVAHGGLHAGSVHLDARGAPVLAGYGRATLRPGRDSTARRAGDAALVDDRRRLLALARAVLDRAGAPPLACIDVAADGDPATPDPAFPARLAAEVFGLGPARPVHLDARGPGRVIGAPARLVPARPASAAESPTPRRRELHARRARPVRRASVALDALTARLVDPRPLGALRAAALDRVREVRRPVWIAAGAVAAALVGVLLLVPGDPPGHDPRPGSADASPGERSADGVASPVDSAPPGGDGIASSGGGIVPDGAAEEAEPDGADAAGTDAGGAGGGATGGGATGAEGGDGGTTAGGTADPAHARADPAAVAVVLLGSRRECVRQLSLDCLAGVDDPSGEAMTDDAAAIRALLAGDGDASGLPAVAAAPASARLDQRLGDGALMTAVDAAGVETRVLVMRLPVGWRIRSFPPDATGTSG